MKISNYISDLLLFHEKVVLPGFGAFVFLRQPAGFKDNKAYPPKVYIGFNPNETLDDKLLSSKIAEAEEIGKDEAHQQVLEFIDQIKFAHNKGEGFQMPGFGELILDSDNDYVFKKDPGFKIDFESSGFESFELDPFDDQPEDQPNVPVDESVPELVSEETTGGHPMMEEMPAFADVDEPADYMEERKSNRSFMWILAGSIVVILVSFSILAISTDVFKNLNTGIFSGREKSATDKPPITLGGDQGYEKEFEAAIDSLTRLENALKPVIDPLQDPSASVYSEFHIIAGSFSVYKNAEDLQKELNFLGYPSVILNRGDGFFRVSAISYYDKEEAMTQLEKFKEATPYTASWVLGLN